MKRVFGTAEIIFDIFYLSAALTLGLALVLSAGGNPPRALAGVMALLLAGGDAFHLVPRIMAIRAGGQVHLRRALGRGKQITSITMSVFYLLLWRLGLLLFPLGDVRFWSYSVYILTAARIILCLLPQNRWEKRHTPIFWGIFRNIPFFMQGAIVAGLFFLQRHAVFVLSPMWLAVVLSFAFYIPVVFWSNTNPKVGMLMLPKSCAYLWILAMCLSI